MKHSVWLLLLLPPAMAANEEAASPATAVDGGTAQAEAGEEAVPVDERLRERLDALELNYKFDDRNNAALVFTFEDGRSQQVWVRNRTYTSHGLEMRDIWSYAYAHRTKFMPGYLERRLMVANHDLVIGMWARQDNDIIYMAKLPADASAEVLQAALYDAAEQADMLEEELHGTDEF